MAKLGPHCLRATAGALAWASVAPVVKALDDARPLREARPEAIRVYRRYWHPADQQLDADPRAVADAILAGLGGYRHPLLYVEVYNEVGKAGRDQYVNLLRRVVPLLHAAGLRVAGPSWATGDYEQADWVAFRAAGWCGVDAIALHAYWAGAGLTPWNALRYRTYWQRGDPPVLITECGRDRVRDGYGGVYIGGGGWQNDHISGEVYVDELRAYDAELAKDPYVLGATVFTAGAEGGDWRAYDTDGLGLERIFYAEARPMGLREQYPNEFAAWERAGGVEHHFRDHLLGIGRIAPTVADLDHLRRQVEAKLAEYHNVARALAPKA